MKPHILGFGGNGNKAFVTIELPRLCLTGPDHRREIDLDIGQDSDVVVMTTIVIKRMMLISSFLDSCVINLNYRTMEGAVGSISSPGVMCFSLDLTETYIRNLVEQRFKHLNESLRRFYNLIGSEDCQPSSFTISLKMSLDFSGALRINRAIDKII